MATAIEGGRAWWVAPSYPVATVGWRLVKRLAIQIPGVEIRHVDRLISLPGGGEVQVRSADNPDSLRGEGLDFLVMDECAFIKEDAWTHALRPALSDRRGGAMFISTPNGRNWFWQLWQRGRLDESGEWESWQLPTTDNPFIDPAEVESARPSQPAQVFQQEYLAEFLEDGVFFTGVRDAATLDPRPATPGERNHVIGVDWARTAGGDYTVFSVIDAATREQVAMQRTAGDDFDTQLNRLAYLHEQYPGHIVAEYNSLGMKPVEDLQRAGLPVTAFTTTAASKHDIITGLALAIERGHLGLLVDEIQLAELEAYQRIARAGIPSYTAPDGFHDDTVMALALAWHGVGSGRWEIY